MRKSATRPSAPRCQATEANARAPQQSAADRISIDPDGARVRVCERQGMALPMSADVPSAARAGQTLWRRWLIATTLGELAGFSVPATIGAVAYALDAPSAVLFLSLVVAGAGEGALLALAQAHVLRGEIACFDRRAWVVATALAASFAWSLGLLPSSLGDRLDETSLIVVIPVSLVLGAALLLSLGVAQWWVLRRYVKPAALWIPANVIAWLVGLGLSVTLMSVLLTEETTTPAAIAIGLGAGLLMGITVAAVTGRFLVRILRRSR